MSLESMDELKDLLIRYKQTEIEKKKLRQEINKTLQGIYIHSAKSLIQLDGDNYLLVIDPSLGNRFQSLEYLSSLEPDTSNKIKQEPTTGQESIAEIKSIKDIVVNIIQEQKRPGGILS